MELVDLYDSLGKRSRCRFGGTLTYPVGDTQKIIVGSSECIRCPCFDKFEQKINDEMVVICHYPNRKNK